jgi:hypothetical protein
MKIQLHWQWIIKGKAEKSEMKAQREATSDDDIRSFLEETKREHPLPEGAVWLMCNEKSKFFIKQD